MNGQNPFEGFGFGGAGAATINDIFGDLFGEMFGGGARGAAARPPRGSDLRYHLEVSFEDAAFGTTARIDIPRSKRCDTCKGSGAKPGHAAAGLPHLRRRRRGAGLDAGFFTMARTCPTCGGEGRVIADQCDDVRRRGRDAASRPRSR